MKIQPVKSTPHPVYPTREMLNAHPELLRLVPRRWQGNAVVLSALLAASAFTLTPAHAEGTTVKKPVSRVAPLFPIGVDANIGRLKGDMPPPTYLTEAEARQIVLDEAKKAGLTFEADAQTLKDLPVAVGNKKTTTENGKSPTLTITLDGTDKAHHIAYEFISKTDMDELAKAANTYCDPVENAKMLRDTIEKAAPEGTYAVFYNVEAGTAEYTKEQLRKQVQDFVKWLKAQGVI